MKKFNENLENLIIKSEKIIDIGCSEQSVSDKSYSAESFKIGIDNCFDRLRLNRQFKNRIAADIYNLPFKKIEFDFVIIKYVLEHLDNPLKAVDNISGLVKSGGYVYAAVPKYYAFQDSLYRMLGYIAELLKKGKQAHISRFTFARFLELFYNNDFYLENFYEADAGLSFLDRSYYRKIFKKIVIGFIKIFEKIFSKNLLERNEMHFLLRKK
jgi:SAM-dependent methyltransferase